MSSQQENLYLRHEYYHCFPTDFLFVLVIHSKVATVASAYLGSSPRSGEGLDPRGVSAFIGKGTRRTSTRDLSTYAHASHRLEAKPGLALALSFVSRSLWYSQGFTPVKRTRRYTVGSLWEAWDYNPTKGRTDN
jgi:hypothetical protein